MRDFILRARKGPTTPNFSIDNLPGANHLEIVTHCIANSLFYSLNLRARVCVHIVFDGPSDPPKTIRIESDKIASLDGFDERALAKLLFESLAAGRNLHLNCEVNVRPGVFIAKRSFETLVRQHSIAGQLFVLQRKGKDVREITFPEDSTFVFSDHMSMPKNTDKFLQRLGAERVSLGPKMLFASQCITLVQDQLDRQGVP